MLDVKFKIKPGHSSERTWMRPAPLKTLFWNVTYACNYHCGICFTDAGHPYSDELTTQEAMDMISKAQAAGIQDIIISGGEPFLRKDMVTILTHMANLGISARIASNGSLLTDELLSQLRHETITKSFQISLDTLDPTLYGEIHGTPPDSLHSILSTLRRIHEHGFHTTVSVRLTPQTLPGILKIMDNAYAEGWSTVTIHCPLNTQRSNGALPQETDFLTLLRPAFEHFCALPHRWLIETYIPWAQYHPVVKRFQEHIRFVHRGCSAGRDHLTINPSGWILPCVCLDTQVAYVGNVRQDDLADVFHNSPICDMMRHPEKHGICVNCSNVSTCGGGCRTAAFVLTGRLDGQDKSCPIWRSRMNARDTYAHDAP